MGPAFDTMTLSTPTPRKLIGCWMEQAGFKTLIVPEVWRELTKSQAPASRQYPIAAWEHIVGLADSPFDRVELTDEQNEVAYTIRARFTTACFPSVHPTMFHSHSDAIIVSQAMALGTDALVTGDVKTIDHYEVNHIAAQVLGRNAPFVTTLDHALGTAYPSGQAAEHFLALALATVAPAEQETDWSVDAAHQSLEALCAAMAGASLTTTAKRLDTRWDECRDLTALLDKARSMAAQSNALRCERVRARMHRQGLAALNER